MPSEQLEEASTKLRDAHKKLIDVQRESRLKSPKNSFARTGYAKYTAFAMNCRLRFHKPRRKLNQAFSFNSLQLPFSDFASTNISLDDLDGGSYLDEIELWNGFRGDYQTVAEYSIQQLQTKIDASNPIFLNISPKELLLTQLSGKLKAQAGSNLLAFREHYRFPDDSSSLVHYISMYPLKCLLTPRDYLVFSTYIQNKNGTILYCEQSVKHLLPESKGCVRAVCKLFGMRIDPTDKGCKVHFVTDRDPSVWIPRFSFEDYLVEQCLSQLRFCEAVIIQLRRTPQRLSILFNQFLKHLKSVEFDLENLEEVKVLEDVEDGTKQNNEETKESSPKRRFKSKKKEDRTDDEDLDNFSIGELEKLGKDLDLELSLLEDEISDGESVSDSENLTIIDDLEISSEEDIALGEDLSDNGDFENDHSSIDLKYDSSSVSSYSSF